MICIGCGRSPDEIPEYIELADDEGISPDEYVEQEEGTYNQTNGHFLCTECYIDWGMPSKPGGWRAP